MDAGICSHDGEGIDPRNSDWLGCFEMASYRLNRKNTGKAGRVAAFLAILLFPSILFGGCGNNVPDDLKEAEMKDKQESNKKNSQEDGETDVVQISITINPSERHQTMDGFGTSGCWWAQDVGTWDEPVKVQIADWLFDPDKGIGLTQYRFNAGGGGLNESKDPWRRVETFETAPGTYDWTRDAGSVAMMRLAAARGVNDILVFANSPPGRMLKNGRTTGDDKGESNLKSGMEDDFARYLVDIADHFKAEGLPVRYISPINEPQWNWKPANGQEGNHYTPQGVLDVGRALARELKLRESDIRISLADSGKMWDADYTLGLYRQLGSDPEFADWLPHFAVHAYWSSEDDKKKLSAAIADSGLTLPVWQTEWCQMEGGSDFGMVPALVLARCVHEDLTILDCTAWQSWIAISCYDYKDGLVHVEPATKKATAMKRLWALGNWSRFVRPGYSRIAVESTDDAMLVSAWLSPNGNEVVLVIVNEGKTSISTDMAGLADRVGLSDNPTMTAWETSEAHNLEKVSEGGIGISVFPARSITTLVVR